LTITGLVSESELMLSLSIANTTLGKFIYFSYPLQVNLGCDVAQNVTFTVVFENIGNNNITERIVIYVKNSSLDTIASYYDDYYNLAPLDFRNFSVNWTSSSKGTYWVIANASYNSTFENKTEVESHSFVVTSKEGIGTLRRFPNQIVHTIPPGRSRIYPADIQLWLQDACNSTTAIINKTQGIPADWVSFSQNNLYLTPDVINSTDVNITISPLTPEGIYNNGTIFAYADGQRVDIGLKITVEMTDIILRVNTQENKVCQSNNVNANINITKIIPPEDINVNVTYQILDSNYTVYDEKKDYNLLLSNISIQKLYSLTVPSSANESFYMFLVTLDYNSTLTQAYDTFEVISCPTTTSISAGGGGGVGGEGGPSGKIEKLEVHKLSLNLSDEILTVITGNKTSFTASVKNIGTESVKSVKISIEGLPSEWINIFPTTADLSVGEVKKYLVVMDIPNETKTGVYKLKVKATNDVESNTIILTLIIGRDPKEVAELLLKELESIRAEVKRSLLVEDCINTTSIKKSYQDAELAFEKGMKDYENKNYEGAINWFEYALPIEKKVVDRVDIALELEIDAINTTKPVSVIPPFFKPEEQLQLAGTYLQEKNYEKICDPILEIKRLIFIGLIFWFIIVILVILIIIIVILIKRKRKEEVYKETDLIIPPTS
jgi:hypothetical protein